MKAKYIGSNSTDFINGKEYELDSEIGEIRIGGAMGSLIPCITLYDKNSTSYCSYESFEDLLKDWFLIQDE